MKLFKFRGFGLKKNTVTTNPPELKILETPTPVITYGFRYKFQINYKGDKGTETFSWTSEIYKDYAKALFESRRTIAHIAYKVNNESSDEYVFIIDACFKKSQFLNASALDVELVVFHDRVLQKTIQISVIEGSNLIIKKSDDSNMEKIHGDFIIKVEND
jgi:hypothetical protein